MAKSIISEGKTTNEAIEKGLKQLNVSKKMVDVKILESEGKRSCRKIFIEEKPMESPYSNKSHLPVDNFFILYLEGK